MTDDGVKAFIPYEEVKRNGLRDPPANLNMRMGRKFVVLNRFERKPLKIESERLIFKKSA